jgi:hypothetical protein
MIVPNDEINANSEMEFSNIDLNYEAHEEITTLMNQNISVNNTITHEQIQSVIEELYQDGVSSLIQINPMQLQDDDQHINNIDNETTNKNLSHNNAPQQTSNSSNEVISIKQRRNNQRKARKPKNTRQLQHQQAVDNNIKNHIVETIATETEYYEPRLLHPFQMRSKVMFWGSNLKIILPFSFRI